MAITIRQILEKESTMFATQGYVTDGYTDKMKLRLSSKYNSLRSLSTFEFHLHTVQSEKEYTEYTNFLDTLRNEIWYEKLNINRGHTFGTLDLDYALIRKARQSGVKWLFKSSDDIVITESILDIEVPKNVDFMYLPSISYEDIMEGRVSHTKYDNFNDGLGYWLPQTNFFLIRVDKLQGDLFDPTEVHEFYEMWKKEPAIKPWELKFRHKFDCETFLKNYVKRNALKPKLLISEPYWSKLISVIINKKIGDPSHKNIMFSECGVMHLGKNSYNINV